MKSRTSSFNLTVLKKDIVRFAPSWILYTVGLLVTFMVCLDSYNSTQVADALGSTVYAMFIVSFCYALLNVQLLFGDLFQSRMANALHALPLRREHWFAIHTVSGLLFALVPNLLMTLCMVFCSGSIPVMPWLWFLWTMGSYVFFFGLAVLCAVCVGSRFALVVVYGIVNFASLLACWLYDTVFLPLLYGLTLNTEPFLQFSPISYGTVYPPYDLYWDHPYTNLHLTVNPEMLIYLGIVTVIGVLFGALALVMYRKRHLESAGDFISAPWLKPVFLVLYTVAMGVVFQWTLGLFTNTEWVYLFIGLTIGYFTGQMLLMRTTRIFVKQTFAGLAAMLLVTAVALGITALDPLGVTRWVPKAEEVSHVTVQLGGTYLEAESGEDLDLLLRFHQTTLDNRFEDPSPDKGRRAATISYTMTDGRGVVRYYLIPVTGTAHMVLEPMLSRPEAALDKEIYENWEKLWPQIEVYCDPFGFLKPSQAAWESLIAAVEQDCAEGNLIQDGNFHPNSYNSVQMLSFEWKKTDERGITYYQWEYLEVYADSTHVLEWIKNQTWTENPLFDDLLE